MIWLRRSLFVVLGLGVLAALGAAAGLWLLGTESGTAWALERWLARVPVITVGRTHGSLLGGLVVEDVRVRLPHDELDIARLALDWDPAAALGGTLAFRRAAATTAAYRRVAGTTADTGQWPELPFAVRVSVATVDALTVSVGGETVAFGPTELGATLRGLKLAVDRVASSSAGFTLTGSADLGLSAALTLDATVQWSGPIAATPAAGSATLSGTWPTLRVQHELTAPFAARAEGTLDFAEEPRTELAIDWRDLAWPGSAGLASPSGRLSLVGTLSDFRYDGAGMLVIDGREAEFAARGTGAGLQLALERLELDPRTGAAGAGVLVANGNVDLAAGTTSLAVTATDANPAWWQADWPGRLRGTAVVRAGLAPVGVAFDSLDIAGALRGYPLTLRGAAEYTAGGRWRLAGVRLASGANRVAIDGGLTATSLELTADADIANLDLLWPGLRGAAAGKVTLGGSFDQPSGRGRLVGHELVLGEYTLAQVVIEGELGGAPATPLALRVEATGAARGTLRVERLIGAANGTMAAHRVTLDFDAEEWHAHAAGDGALSSRLWRGTLTQAEFDENLLGRWQLVEPSAVAIGARQASLATTCFEHESAGRWCGELDVRGQPGDRYRSVGAELRAQDAAAAVAAGALARGRLPALGVVVRRDRQRAWCACLVRRKDAHACNDGRTTELRDRLGRAARGGHATQRPARPARGAAQR